MSDEAHRDLRVRAARRGRSTEAGDRVKLGSLLAEIGRQAAMTDEEWAAFASRDATPGRPVSFEGVSRLRRRP